MRRSTRYWVTSCLWFLCTFPIAAAQGRADPLTPEADHGINLKSGSPLDGMAPDFNSFEDELVVARGLKAPHDPCDRAAWGQQDLNMCAGEKEQAADGRMKRVISPLGARPGNG